MLADKTSMFKRDLPDGNTFVRYDIRVKFTSNLNYHFFRLRTNQNFTDSELPCTRIEESNIQNPDLSVPVYLAKKCT